MRKAVVLISALVLLALVNVGIWQKEHLLRHGTEVLIELAPVDPRSLLQGDYLRLSYRLERDLLRRDIPPTHDGYLLLSLDANRVASLRQISDNPHPGQGEIALRYRLRNGHIRLASNAFFFQEGTAADYRGARYGLFRVSASGEALLTGLCDANFRRLGPLPAEN